MAGVRYCIRQTLRSNLLAALLFYASSGLFFRFRTMDTAMLIRMGEMYLPLAGIFLFVPLSCYEQEHGADDFVYMKRKFFPGYILIRLFVLILISVFLGMIYFRMVCLVSEKTEFVAGLCLGLQLGQLSLGLIAMTIAELTGRRLMGLVGGFLWFLIDTLTKGTLMGPVTLLGYYTERPWTKQVLGLICVILVVIQLVLIERKASGRTWIS